MVYGDKCLDAYAAATALNPFHELADVRRLLPFADTVTVTVLDPRGRGRELAHQILDH
jgi:pentose-5-phosphate-3-epimerase